VTFADLSVRSQRICVASGTSATQRAGLKLCGHGNGLLLCTGDLHTAV